MSSWNRWRSIIPTFSRSKHVAHRVSYSVRGTQAGWRDCMELGLGVESRMDLDATGSYAHYSENPRETHLTF
jgi:hypothetical protein